MKTAILPLLALALAGCAAGYSGRQEQGRIVVDSESKTSLVYFLRRHDYEEQIVPLLAKGGDAVADHLARTRSGIPAQGQLVVHRAGNFNMIYFCGNRVRMLPVQILTTSDAETPNRYTLVCAD